MDTKFSRYFPVKKYTISVMVLAFLLFIVEILSHHGTSVVYARNDVNPLTCSTTQFSAIPSYCEPVFVDSILYSCLQVPDKSNIHYAPEEYHAIQGIEKVKSSYSSDFSVYTIKNLPLNEELAGSIVQCAKQFVGVPYLPGGTSPSSGFDCSGFVFYVLHRCGYRFTERTCNGLHDICALISPEEVKPGDLAFFRTTTENKGYSHVGIYIGDGKMLHAGMKGICLSDVYNEYWIQHMPSFGRLYPEAALQ